jgi:hypothetical protein
MNTWKDMKKQADGGRGGIRTHGTLAGTPVFKTGALNHSATLPCVEVVQLFIGMQRTYEDSATALLPNVVGALVYGRPEHDVNRRGRISLHIRHQMAVGIHGDRDARMPEPFLHYFRVDVRGEHMAGVGMPQAVQGDTPRHRATSIKSVREAMLFFQQASRTAGKSSGRTADKAIIPTVSEKSLPVYFVKDAGLKEQMVQGQSNPLTDTTYIVDADVQLIDGEPRGYVVTHVHKVIEGGE